MGRCKAGQMGLNFWKNQVTAGFFRFFLAFLVQKHCVFAILVFSCVACVKRNRFLKVVFNFQASQNPYAAVKVTTRFFDWQKSGHGCVQFWTRDATVTTFSTFRYVDFWGFQCKIYFGGVGREKAALFDPDRPWFFGGFLHFFECDFSEPLRFGENFSKFEKFWKFSKIGKWSFLGLGLGFGFCKKSSLDAVAWFWFLKNQATVALFFAVAKKWSYYRGFVGFWPF